MTVHTVDEFNLFHSAVSPGGEYASAHGLPNFDQMVRWWPEKANGKTIFYKLQEHLTAHYKTWSEHRLVIESPVQSQFLTSSGLDRDRDWSTKVLIPQKTGLDHSGPVF